MTEWEKLEHGLVYDDFDDDLFARRMRAKELFKAYNKTDGTETEKREQLLAELFNKIGDHVWIEPDLRCEIGKKSRSTIMSISTLAVSSWIVPQSPLATMCSLVLIWAFTLLIMLWMPVRE